MKTITAQQISDSRNRFKRRYQMYLYEFVMIACKRFSKEIIGKESVSEFAFVCICYVLGKLGMKFDFLNEQDRRKIIALHRRIT